MYLIKHGCIWFLVMLTLLLACSKLEQPSLDVQVYAAFHAERLMIQKAYPDDSQKQWELIAQSMKYHHLDSLKLAAFYAYYERRPEKWIEVEQAVGKALESLAEKKKEDYQVPQQTSPSTNGS